MMSILITSSASLELPTVMQNIGLAILTIFIPLGVYIFEQRKDYSYLDQKIISEQIISGLILLIGIGLIFLPLLFWDISTYCYKTLIVGFWALGASYGVYTLIKAYKWIISDDKTVIRMNFLKALKKPGILNAVWKSVWGSKSNNQIEREYFKIFSDKIDSLK